MKIFEYIIKVPTQDLDNAKAKLEQVKKAGIDAAKSVGNAFKETSTDIKQNIKDYGVLGAAGKGVIKGLSAGFKGLKGAVQGVGEILKANPLFTLATILVPLIGKIQEFIMNLEFVQDLFAAVGKVLTFVIDLLKSFSDWIGLTSFAEEEAAEKAKEANKERIAINEAMYGAMFQDMENEIRLMEAQGASIDEIEEKQLQLARTKAAVAKQAQKDNTKLILDEIRLAKEAGESTVELQKQLIQLKQNAKQADADLKLLETNVSNSRKQRAADDAAAKQKEADDEKKRKADAAKAAAEERKRRLAEEAAFAAERERVRRQIEDLSIAAITDQTERELEANRIKYQRLTADTKANVKLLESEKTALIAAFQVEELAAATKINQAKADKEKEEALKAEELKLKAVAEYQALIKSQRDLTEFEKRQEEAELAKQNEIQLLKNLLDAKAINQAEYDQMEIDAKQKLADSLLQIELDRIEAERVARVEKIAADIETAAAYAGTVNSLAQSIFTVSNNLGKQDEKAKLERAKRQFKVQKALDIVTAGINGALSITKAIVQFGPPPSPLGIAAIASSAAVTIASIAAIASKKFDGGESAGSTGGSLPNVSSAVTTPAESSTPTFNLFGRNAGSTAQAAGTTENNGGLPMTIKAYVTETDIVETTDRLDKIRTNSEL
jgi:hypothetical protein